MQLRNKILIVSVTVFLFTSTVIPAQAADESNQDTVITLTLPDAKERLLEENTDLKLLENDLDKLYYQLRSSKEDLEDLEDSQDDYEDDLDELEAQLSDLENAKAAFIADQEDPQTPPLSTEEYINGLMNFDAQINRLKQSITSITGSKNALNDTEDSLNAGIDSTRNNIDSLEETEAITEEKLKYSLEKIYIQILSLDLEAAKKESTLSLAKMTLDNENLKYQLGFSQKGNVESANETYLTAKNALDALQNQQEQLMNQLKVLMGYPISTPVNLESIPLDEITLPSYQDGLDEVLDDGVEIHYQEMLYDNQKDYIDDLEDEYNGSEKEIRNEKFKLKEYDINLEETITNTENTYYNYYHNISLLSDNLDIMEKQLASVGIQNQQNHLQYDLGLLSKEELAVKDDVYYQAQLAFKQKQYEYAIAAASYNMAEQGYLIN